MRNLSCLKCLFKGHDDKILYVKEYSNHYRYRYHVLVCKRCDRLRWACHYSWESDEIRRQIKCLNTQ